MTIILLRFLIKLSHKIHVMNNVCMIQILSNAKFIIQLFCLIFCQFSIVFDTASLVHKFTLHSFYSHLVDFCLSSISKLSHLFDFQLLFWWISWSIKNLHINIKIYLFELLFQKNLTLLFFHYDFKVQKIKVCIFIFIQYRYFFAYNTDHVIVDIRIFNIKRLVFIFNKIFSFLQKIFIVLVISFLALRSLVKAFLPYFILTIF